MLKWNDGTPAYYFLYFLCHVAILEPVQCPCIWNERLCFQRTSKSYGMELIVIAILGGQILIVQFGGAVFRTEPLDWQTWLVIIGASSLVLWVGELIRFVQRLIHK